MAAGLLLLICAGAALYSAEAQEPYNGLADNYRQGVDLAFEQLNSHAGVQSHFRFFKSVDKSEIEVNVASDFVITSLHGGMCVDLFVYFNAVCEDFAFICLM